MANCNSGGEWYHNKCMNIPLKVFGMRSTTCNGNALFAENKLCEFRPQTFFCFYCFTTRLLFMWLGLGTFFPPRNLRQFHKFLAQSQSIIEKKFYLGYLQTRTLAKRFTKTRLHEHWHCYVTILLQNLTLDLRILPSKTVE